MLQFTDKNIKLSINNFAKSMQLEECLMETKDEFCEVTYGIEIDIRSWGIKSLDASLHIVDIEFEYEYYGMGDDKPSLSGEMKLCSLTADPEWKFLIDNDEVNNKDGYMLQEVTVDFLKKEVVVN